MRSLCWCFLTLISWLIFVRCMKRCLLWPYLDLPLWLDVKLVLVFFPPPPNKSCFSECRGWFPVNFDFSWSSQELCSTLTLLTAWSAHGSNALPQIYWSKVGNSGSRDTTFHFPIEWMFFPREVFFFFFFFFLWIPTSVFHGVLIAENVIFGL